MTAFLREGALFIPGYERSSPDAPSDFDRLISGYRLILGYRLIGGPLLQTAISTHRYQAPPVSVPMSYLRERQDRSG